MFIKVNPHIHLLLSINEFSISFILTASFILNGFVMLIINYMYLHNPNRLHVTNLVIVVTLSIDNPLYLYYIYLYSYK